MKMPRKQPDPRGGHVRLYWEVMESPAWNCLTASDQRVYLTLARQLTKTNNGDVCLPITKARHYQIRSATTLAKSLRALVAVGLIDVTRRGGSTRDGRREPTLYAFSDMAVYDMPKKFIEARPPTNKWKQIKSLAHGNALIKMAETEAGERAATKKTALQILIATTPNFDSKTPKTTPKNGVWPVRPVQKVEHGKEDESSAKPISARVSPKSPVSAAERATLQKVESLCITAIHTPGAVAVGPVADSGVESLAAQSSPPTLKVKTQRRPPTAKPAPQVH